LIRLYLISIKNFNLDISVPNILNTSLTVETGDKPESTEQTDIDQIESNLFQEFDSTV